MRVRLLLGISQPKNSSQKNPRNCGTARETSSRDSSWKPRVYIIDECHLLWNDICGYLWNLIKDPLKIPLLNPKERQTYYGALNLLTQEFVLIPYKTANGELTVEFVLTLQAKNPETIIF